MFSGTSITMRELHEIALNRTSFQTKVTCHMFLSWQGPCLNRKFRFRAIIRAQWRCGICTESEGQASWWKASHIL